MHAFSGGVFEPSDPVAERKSTHKRQNLQFLKRPLGADLRSKSFLTEHYVKLLSSKAEHGAKRRFWSVKLNCLFITTVHGIDFIKLTALK